MQRIKNMEFLRIIGCIAIIILHLFLRLNECDGNFFQHYRLITSNGNKAVDLFFIISGVFFAFTLNTKQSVWEFAKKKLARFCPVLIVVTILTFLLSLIGVFKFSFHESVLILFLLNGTGLTAKTAIIPHVWYISALFWVLVSFFYLLKYFDRKKVNLIVFFAIFFSYGFLIQAKGGKISGHEQNFYYIFNVGILRAVAGIGIGYFIGEWYKNNLETIKNYVFNIHQKWFLTLVEFMCLYFTINNLMLQKINFKNDLIFIITFAVLIVSFLLKGGYISRFLDKDFWGKCSKYIYSIYMFHFIIFHAFKKLILLTNMDFLLTHPVFNIACSIIIGILGGVLIYHFIEKPAVKYFTTPKRERERERMESRHEN